LNSTASSLLSSSLVGEVDGDGGGREDDSSDYNQKAKINKLIYKKWRMRVDSFLWMLGPNRLTSG
jgi:hypothetical protein